MKMFHLYKKVYNDEDGPVSTPPSIRSPFETAKFTIEEMAKDNYLDIL